MWLGIIDLSNYTIVESGLIGMATGVIIVLVIEISFLIYLNYKR